VKPPILVGIGLAVVIAAATLVAPQLRSAASKSAEQAQEQAALAQRKLRRVDQLLPRLDALADIQGMRAADLGSAVSDAGEALQSITTQYAQALRELERFTEAQGLTGAKLQPLSANTAGVQRALSAFQEALKGNDALLKAAIGDARAAVGTDRTALGVAQVLGMAEYVHAAQLLDEAHDLRRRQLHEQAELLTEAAGWRLAQTQRDHFRGLDVEPIVNALHDDLQEIKDRGEAAAARVEELSQRVAAQEQALREVDQTLSQASQDLLQLEKEGFTAGDDASFAAYRERYLELSRKLQQAQEREQELRFGGLRGAQFVGDNIATAELVGGERVEGLGELQRQLALATALDERWTTASTSLEEHEEYVVKMGEDAQGQMERFAQDLAASAERQNAIAKDIDTFASEAYEKETEALRALEAAVSAFGQAQNAAVAWVRAARDLQSEKDPERSNERLRVITEDPNIEQVGRSAGAAARLLAGRIHAQRVESCQRLIDDMRLFTELNPRADFEFDPTRFQQQLQAARETGLDTLEEARSHYEQIASQLRSRSTDWVPLAGLAAVHHLLARIDPTQAAEQLDNARNFIGQSAEKGGELPYAKTFVRFKDHLVGGEGASEPETDDFFESEGDEDY